MLIHIKCRILVIVSLCMMCEYEDTRNNGTKTKGGNTMEANKIKGEAKALKLANGAELTYCERGENNEEIVVMPGFFFYTFMPMLEGLAERYHVYGVIMRFDGPGDELNEDGSINWTRQWGKDIYDFCEAMGIRQYIHFGKCHGSVPGWYMVKEHPEMVKYFASFFLAPHVKEQNSNNFFSLEDGVEAFMARGIRKVEEGLAKKMEEAAAIGMNKNDPATAAKTQSIIQTYASAPEMIWGSKEACAEGLKNMTVPVGFLFGTEDEFFDDHFDSNMWAIRNTRGSRTIFLQGEHHLMELDCPQRVVKAAFDFYDECEKGYYKELMG